MPVYVYPSVQYAKLQGYDGTTWQNLLVQSSTYPNLRVSIYQDGNEAVVASLGLDSIAETTNALRVAAFLKGYNGTGWDRLRTHMVADLGTFTAAGAGASVDTVTGFDKWTWTVVSDASATALTVNLEGSIDGTNWFVLDTYTGTANTMRHVVNKPVRYIRANVTSMGDATSITVKVFGMR